MESQRGLPDEETSVEVTERNISQSVDHLRATLEEWSSITRQLVKAQNDEARKNRYLAILTLAVSVLAIVTTIAVGGLFQQTKDVADRLSEVNRKTSQEVTCPIYDRFLDAWNPDSPAARNDPEGYEITTQAIERGAAINGCAHAKRGPG